MITLALDASTYAGDVCLLDDDRVLADVQVEMKGAHEERLMPAVESALARASLPVDAIDRVICGAGPGSFTSLRIAAGIAKGLASGLDVPLYAVPSLALLVAGADPRTGVYLAALDALRGEFYVGLYRVGDSRGEGRAIYESERARLVGADDVAPLAESLKATIVSPSRFVDGIVATPRSHGVARLGAWIESVGAVDLEAWEPAYGRLAEAQVRWESVHGRPLATG